MYLLLTIALKPIFSLILNLQRPFLSKIPYNLIIYRTSKDTWKNCQMTLCVIEKLFIFIFIVPYYEYKYKQTHEKNVRPFEFSIINVLTRNLSTLKT